MLLFDEHNRKVKNGLSVSSTAESCFCISVPLPRYQLKSLTDKQTEAHPAISGHFLIKLIPKLEREVENFWFQVKSLMMNQLSCFMKATGGEKHFSLRIEQQGHVHAQAPHWAGLQVPSSPQVTVPFPPSVLAWPLPLSWSSEEKPLNRDGRRIPFYSRFAHTQNIESGRAH